MRSAHLYDGVALAALGCAGSAIAFCAVFAEASTVLAAMESASTVAVGALIGAGMLCAPRAHRRRLVRPRNVAFWLVWCAPALAWTALGRYSIGSGTDLLVIVVAAGAPTALIAWSALLGEEEDR